MIDTQNTNVHLPFAAMRPALDNTFEYMGLLLSFLVPSAATAGRLAIIHVHARDRSEPVPHIHFNEDEIYLILEGGVEFYIEGQAGSVMCHPGDTIFLPCGKAHALKYRSPEIKMMMTLSATGDASVGAEGFFRSMALGPARSLDLNTAGTHYADLDADDLVELASLAGEAGLELLPPDAAERLLPAFPGL